MAEARLRRTALTLVAGLALAMLAVPGVLAAAGVVELGRAGGGATSAWETAASAAWPADAVLYHVFADRSPTATRRAPGSPELPQLNLDHPPARAWVFDEVLPIYLDDIGVDGFRLDHVEGPSRDFWRAFDAELRSR